jgi:hypothetical protein
MSQPFNILLRAINYDHTLVLEIELSNKSWVLAAQVPGLPKPGRSAPSSRTRKLRWQQLMATELAVLPSVTRSIA